MMQKAAFKSTMLNDKSLHYKYKYDASDKIRSVQNMLTGQKTKREYNEIGDIITETLESGLKLSSPMTLPEDSLTSLFLIAPRSNMATPLPSCSQYLALSWKYEITARDLSGHILASTLPKNAGNITYCYDQLGRKTETSHPVFNEQAAAFDRRRQPPPLTKRWHRQSLYVRLSLSAYLRNWRQLPRLHL